MLTDMYINVRVQESGPCAEKFSYPKFFENQWIAEQEVSALSEYVCEWCDHLLAACVI